MAHDKSADSEFEKFWNSVLEPKFTKYRHILCELSFWEIMVKKLKHQPQSRFYTA
jgi:hypothetical protein